MSTTGKTYAITGANRGLGLEFVRHLSLPSSAPNTIIAAVRSLSGELADLEALRSQVSSSSSGGSNKATVHILECDTSSPSSIASFGTALTKTLGGEGKKLDYMINNAGINATPDQMALGIEAEDLQTHININVLGPAKTVEAVLPHLQFGSVVVNMTSGLGSCGKRVIKCTTYSISKAALNMLTVHQAGDEELVRRGVRVICMDPGWVKTRMGGSEAILEKEESIGGMLRTIHKVGEKESGRFYTYTGEEVPW